MFDFVRHRAAFYLVPAAIIAQPVDEAALRNAFVQLQHPEAVVQHASGTDTFVVRTTTLKQPSHRPSSRPS